jgi:hypothetical protein
MSYATPHELALRHTPTSYATPDELRHTPTSYVTPQQATTHPDAQRHTPNEKTININIIFFTHK